MENITQRPWQGTTVAVINAIGLGIGIIAFLLFLFAGSFITTMLEQTQYAMLAQASSMLIAFILLPFLILAFFITRGLFKGQIWTIIVSLIFTGLSLIGNLTTLNFISIVINGFMIYCLVICLNAEFYKKKQ